MSTPNDDVAEEPQSVRQLPDNLLKIEHFVVLMLENRSFDHLFGALNQINPRIEGLTGTESNFDCPNAQQPGEERRVYPAERFDMPFDPPHEFLDVQFQLYGPIAGKPGQANPPIDRAAMSGFVFRARTGVPRIGASDWPRVMSYFQPQQIPVLRTLAENYAVCNSWHSSLPGPTWPNRFFVHAATSGGLNYSPSTEQIIAGFTFKNGTIYDRLGSKPNDWHIYHDGIPQCIGISDLRWNFLKQQTNPFDSNFRPMEEFETDIVVGDLAPYTFIEPNYDTGHNYLGGNSMHPLNDIRNGEALIKRVYEALRKSKFWEKTMLVITFDEHGGFYDHVSPPAAVSTSDDHRYVRSDTPFMFDRLGVRVPTLVISAYTQKGTTFGGAVSGGCYDHASILATVQKRFKLRPLTSRDASAQTLDVALNLAAARLSSEDAPMTLPDPAFDETYALPAPAAAALTAAAADQTPISDNQQTFLALAAACELELTDISRHQDIRNRYDTIVTQGQAAEYMNSVIQKLQPPND